MMKITGRSQNRLSVFLIFLFLVGATLRIIFSFVLPLDGGDEAYQLLTAQKPLIPLLTATLSSTGPAWIVILHFLMKVSTNYVHIRLVTSIIGSFSIILAAYWGKSFFNWKIGLMTALVFAISPTLIYYSAYSRPYSLAIFASLIIFFMLSKFLKSDSRKISLLLFLVLALGNYVIFFMPIISVCFLSFLLLFKQRFKKKIIKFAFIFLMSLLASLPLYVASLRVEPLVQAVLPTISFLKVIVLPLHFTTPLNLIQLTNLYPKLEMNLTNLLLLILSVFTLLVAMFSIIKKPDKKIFFLVLMLVESDLIMITISLIGPSIYGFRTMLIFSIPFYLLIAKVLTSSRKLALIYTLLTTITLISILDFFINKPHTLENFLAYNLRSQQTLIHTEINTFYYYSYLMPQLKHAAAVDSLYTTNTNKELLNYLPIDIGDLKGSSFWLLEQPAKIHQVKVQEFKKRLNKSYEVVFEESFGDLILYMYQPK